MNKLKNSEPDIYINRKLFAWLLVAIIIFFGSVSVAALINWNDKKALRVEIDSLNYKIARQEALIDYKIARMGMLSDQLDTCDTTAASNEKACVLITEIADEMIALTESQKNFMTDVINNIALAIEDANKGDYATMTSRLTLARARLLLVEKMEIQLEEYYDLLAALE